MENSTNSTKGKGNTKPSPSEKRCRKWCFTLNNYSENEITQIHKDFENDKIIYGKEVGENNTPHLQGYIEFKEGKTLSRMKKYIPRAHFEYAKGNLESNMKYCSKDGNVYSTFPLTRLQKGIKKYENIIWKEWQQEVIDIVDGPINNRNIYWFYEETGNVGKSFLTKYLYMKYNAIIADGKKTDIFNQINNWLEKNKEEDPLLCLIDIPRACFNNISYAAIEKIQDGLMYSGKYEGGVCCFEPPHVIVFANEEPNYEKCSLDRWQVIKL